MFSGVTCEFEHLNPVRIGHVTALQFGFPARTFEFADVMELDLAGIQIGGSAQDEDGKSFGLLGDVRLKNLAGVQGSLTFGGITLKTGSGRPSIEVNEIGGTLKTEGGFEIDALFRRIKDEREEGFGGSMTVKTSALPSLSGSLILTRARTLLDGKKAPSLALYFEADYELPLIFGFFLRSLGAGLGLNRVLRGLDRKSLDLPLPARVRRFVDDPAGLPNPRVLSSWELDPPNRRKTPAHWMFVGRGLVTFGNAPFDQPHPIAGDILMAIDREAGLVAAVNIWLFTSPDETRQAEFQTQPSGPRQL